MKPKMNRPLRPRRRPSLCERRRGEILEAVAKVFAQRGYRNTDMQHVADALLSGKGTIYRYFHSKEELFLAAVDTGLNRLKEAVETDATTVLDPLARIVRAIHAFFDFFHEYPEIAELLIQERAEFRDRKRQASALRFNDGGPWRELFCNLMAAGRVRRMPPERIMDVVGDLVYGAMFTNRAAGWVKSPEDQAEGVIDVMLHGILTDAERRPGLEHEASRE
jgi:AcrR family transcriptional regulator